MQQFFAAAVEDFRLIVQLIVVDKFQLGQLPKLALLEQRVL